MVSAATWASALMLAAGLILADPGRAGGLPGDEEVYGFDDAPLAEPMDHPSWFKDSFLDLGADLKEAVGAGKQGLIVYFGQRRCAYCQKLLKVNFGLEGIAEYTRAHFDVVAIDVWGVAEVTDIQGRTLIERDYADQLDTVFTPSLLFYNAEGELALRLRGYYPPYQFRAALEYVADAHYRRESFRDYLARGDNRMVFDAQDLNAETFFASPPTTWIAGSRASGRWPSSSSRAIATPATCCTANPCAIRRSTGISRTSTAHRSTCGPTPRWSPPRASARRPATGRPNSVSSTPRRSCFSTSTARKSCGWTPWWPSTGCATC